jgi:energy-coupling factor transporter ATP-binding protein EcfA2
MKTEIRAKLMAFAKSLKDEPLDPDNRCYVRHLEKADGTGDPIKELFNKISFSESSSVTLLSGHRGSGKSTELRRLKKYLEDDGCVVFLSDMRDYLNMTTSVEISDFFISLMGALNEAYFTRFGKNPANENYWERLVNFLKQDVKIGDISFEASMPGVKGGIKASLKDDPTFRQKLQEGLKGHIARLVQEAHEFAVSVVVAVRKETNDPDKKVVFLVDSVEQIRGVGADADHVHRSVENLFSAHADSLHIPLLHVLYTIPPYLTPMSPALGRHLGGGVICHLPSVHVFKERTAIEDEQGLNIMKQVITCRFPNWEQVITEADLRKMALASGGDFRNFFRLITTTLTKADGDSLPISESIVRAAEDHLRREMLPIAEDDMVWLSKIAESKDVKLATKELLPRLAGFFDTSLIQNYRNGADWYDVHPLLRELVKNAI